MRKLLTVIPALVLICSSTQLFGSNELVREERNVKGFDRVSLGGTGYVYLTQGNEEKLVVEAREEILPFIETDISRGKLHLRLKRGYRPRFNAGPINYYLTMKDINGISVSGSGNIETETIKTFDLDLHISGSGDILVKELKGESITVHISGSGDCDVTGKLDRQDIHISGSGEYNASGLKSDDVEVSVSGSGDVEVWVKDELDVHISGSGRVGYYGRPAIDSHSSGSGRTVHLGDR